MAEGWILMCRWFGDQIIGAAGLASQPKWVTNHAEIALEIGYRPLAASESCSTERAWRSFNSLQLSSSPPAFARLRARRTSTAALLFQHTCAVPRTSASTFGRSIKKARPTLLGTRQSRSGQPMKKAQSWEVPKVPKPPSQFCSLCKA